jgi:hypothetical protein
MKTLFQKIIKGRQTPQNTSQSAKGSYPSWLGGAEELTNIKVNVQGMPAKLSQPCTSTKSSPCGLRASALAQNDTTWRIAA